MFVRRIFSSLECSRSLLGGVVPDNSSLVDFVAIVSDSLLPGWIDFLIVKQGKEDCFGCFHPHFKTSFAVKLFEVGKEFQVVAGDEVQNPNFIRFRSVSGLAERLSWGISVAS